MAYSVSYTDSVNKGIIVVEDSTLNTDTSLSLPGRGATAYGQAVAENFLHLLENFANTEPPARPVEGQLWYDNSEGVDQLKIYDGTTWAAAGGLKKSSSEPSVANSLIGDLWVNTDNQQLYLFSGSAWVLVGPDFSDGLLTGGQAQTITGTNNVDYSIFVIKIEDQPVVIYSANAFIPKVAIPGFRTGINVGINLPFTAGALNQTYKFNGTATSAEALKIPGVAEPVAASNFLRSDGESTTDFKLRVKTNDGLQIGSGNQLSIAIQNESGVFQHNTGGSSFIFKLSDGSTYQNVLTIDSTKRVGINTLSPDEVLDVIGNIQISSDPTDATSGVLKVESTINSNDIDEGSIVTKGGIGVALNAYIGGNTDIGGILTTANIAPDSNGSRNIGTTNNKYDQVYSNTFYGNLVGNVTGTITGRAGSANRLTTATTFAISGDVENNSFDFDGTGGTKTFDVRISNSFISSKEVIYDVSDADEILVNKITGTTGVYRVTKRNLLKTIPLIPAGVIVPYGGESAPEGWLLCDGSEVRKSEFNELWIAIGHNFRDPALITDGGVNFFALPDFRGRFPLGWDLMGGTASNRITGGSATYSPISGTNLSGVGYNGFFTVVRSGGVYTVTVYAAGSGYAPGDTIKIEGNRLGGATPTNDLTITVLTTVSGGIATIDISGVAITTPGADAIGNNLGSQFKNIGVGNLPEHEHDMEGASGTQYYSVREGSGALLDTNAINLTLEPGLGGYQGLPSSGGILTTGSLGQPLDVMNPYLTVNYIIYTGQ